MVKPARLGSSVGMTLAHGRPSAEPPWIAPSGTTRSLSSSRSSPARATWRSRSSATITRGLELYGPGEIVSGHEFYDYEAKYTPGMSGRRSRRR
jgi:D-alanine-D-alanine ligase-like ATP-grasp enzyme